LKVQQEQPELVMNGTSTVSMETLWTSWSSFEGNWHVLFTL